VLLRYAATWRAVLRGSAHRQSDPEKAFHLTLAAVYRSQGNRQTSAAMQRNVRILFPREVAWSHATGGFRRPSISPSQAGRRRELEFLPCARIVCGAVVGEAWTGVTYRFTSAISKGSKGVAQKGSRIAHNSGGLVIASRSWCRNFVFNSFFITRPSLNGGPSAFQGRTQCSHDYGTAQYCFQ
jgi:hypothetical protein